MRQCWKTKIFLMAQLSFFVPNARAELIHVGPVVEHAIRSIVGRECGLQAPEGAKRGLTLDLRLAKENFANLAYELHHDSRPNESLADFQMRLDQVDWKQRLQNQSEEAENQFARYLGETNDRVKIMLTEVASGLPPSSEVKKDLLKLAREPNISLTEAGRLLSKSHDEEAISALAANMRNLPEVAKAADDLILGLSEYYEKIEPVEKKYASRAHQVTSPRIDKLIARAKAILQTSPRYIALNKALTEVEKAEIARIGRALEGDGELADLRMEKKALEEELENLRAQYKILDEGGVGAPIYWNTLRLLRPSQLTSADSAILKYLNGSPNGWAVVDRELRINRASEEVNAIVAEQLGERLKIQGKDTANRLHALQLLFAKGTTIHAAFAIGVTRTPDGRLMVSDIIPMKGKAKQTASGLPIRIFETLAADRDGTREGKDRLRAKAKAAVQSVLEDPNTTEARELVCYNSDS